MISCIILKTVIVLAGYFFSGSLQILSVNFPKKFFEFEFNIRKSNISWILEISIDIIIGDFENVINFDYRNDKNLLVSFMRWNYDYRGELNDLQNFRLNIIFNLITSQFSSILCLYKYYRIVTWVLQYTLLLGTTNHAN